LDFGAPLMISKMLAAESPRPSDITALATKVYGKTNPSDGGSFTYT